VAELIDRIAAAVAALRPVDPVTFKVRAVNESVAFMSNTENQVGILPYTDVNGAIVFGQFRYPPIPDDDPVIVAFRATEAQPEPVGDKFTRGEKWLHDLSVLESDAATSEHTVVLIRSGRNEGKRRRYRAEALESAASKYEGVPMFIDHATEPGQKPGGVRKLADMAARVLKTWVQKVEEGESEVRARIHVFDSWLSNKLSDPHFRDLVGLSHDADVSGVHERIGGKVWEAIESIPAVRSVDFVTKAAFGGKVLESDESGLSRRLEDQVALETVTLDELRKARPDLIEAVESAARVQFEARESDDDTAAKLKAAEDKAAQLEREIYTRDVERAVAESVGKPDSGIPDAARPDVVERVTREVAAKGVKGDDLNKAVTESVKNQVEFAGKFSSTAKPRVEPNAVAPKPEATGKEQGVKRVIDMMAAGRGL